MSRRGSRHCFVPCLLVVLAWLLLSEQPQAQEPRYIESLGRGAPPVASADLTTAERVTAARTAALVEALQDLVKITGRAELESQTPVPPARTGEAGTPISGRLEYKVQGLLGENLRVSGRTVVENGLFVKSVAVVEWPACPGSDAPNCLEVEDFILVSPPVRNLDAYALLQKVHEAGVTIVKWDDQLPDGGVGVTVRLPVSKGPGLGQIPVSKGPGLGQVSGTQPPPSCPEVFSGVIVDVRGLGLVPALAPGIVSAGGLEVYGVWVVDRNIVVQEGMSDYAQDLEKAKANPRIGDKPLVVKAIRVEKKTDVVVTDEDGVRLHVANRCSHILEQARVVFFMD